MPNDLVMRPFWDFSPFRMSSLLDDEDSWPTAGYSNGGLSISEDDGSVYIEAAVPGVNPEDVEMTFHNGILKIHGKSKSEEKKDRKNYRSMTNEFSYQVAVRDVDSNVEPEATCKNGVMEVKFAKSKAAQPKQIKVKQ
jgi:HSP20 family protein